jgi:hypothetical protein
VGFHDSVHPGDSHVVAFFSLRNPIFHPRNHISDLHGVDAHAQNIKTSVRRLALSKLFTQRLYSPRSARS